MALFMPTFELYSDMHNYCLGKKENFKEIANLEAVDFAAAYEPKSMITDEPQWSMHFTEHTSRLCFGTTA